MGGRSEAGQLLQTSISPLIYPRGWLYLNHPNWTACGRRSLAPPAPSCPGTVTMRSSVHPHCLLGRKQSPPSKMAAVISPSLSAPCWMTEQIQYLITSLHSHITALDHYISLSFTPDVVFPLKTRLGKELCWISQKAYIPFGIWVPYRSFIFHKTATTVAEIKYKTSNSWDRTLPSSIKLKPRASTSKTESNPFEPQVSCSNTHFTDKN